MKELALTAGVTIKMISEFESGQKTYFKKLEHKKGIANAFGLSLEEFDKMIEG